MKCTKCGYEWVTKSDKMYISCPNCLRKNKTEREDIRFDLLRKKK